MAIGYKHKSSSPAFTIVELLVVIVVIGILAAITIVSYTGISSRATVSSLQSDLTNALTQLKLDQVNSSSSAFPATLALANGGKGISSSSGTTYTYAVSNTTTPQTFCITATKNNISYNITQDGNPQPGICPVLNLDAGNISSYPGTGTTWTDLSGNGNNGTLYGGVSYSAVNGGVLSFDGGSGYVSLGSLNNLSGNTETISFWANQKVVSNYGGFIDSSLGGSDTTVRLYIGYYQSGVPYFCVWTGDGVSAQLLNFGYSIPLNTWKYYAVVLNGGQVSLFINGVLYGSLANSKTLAPGFYSVGRGFGGSGYLNGMVGNINIYNTALGANDILQNFNNLRSRYGI